MAKGKRTADTMESGEPSNVALGQVKRRRQAPTQDKTANKTATDIADPKVIRLGQLNRAKHIQESIKTNPDHVFVIGPPGGAWQDNAKKVAGYLHFSGDGSLEAFRLYITGKTNSGEIENTQSMAVAHALDRYTQIRLVNYSQAVVGSKAGSRVNIAGPKIWQVLSAPDASLAPLYTAECQLPLPANFGLGSDSGRYPVVVHIAAMSMLIQASPKMFPESHGPVDTRQAVVGSSPFPAEDWYRAYVLLKFFWRQHTLLQSTANPAGPTNNKASFLTKVQGANLGGEPADFYTAEEALAGPALSGQDVQYDEHDERATAQVFDETLEEMRVDEQDGGLGGEGEDPERVQYLLGVTDEAMAAQTTEFEQSLLQRWKADDKSSQLGLLGRRVRRPALTRRQVRDLCRKLGYTCKVKHDDPTMSSTEAAEAAQREEMESNPFANNVQQLQAKHVNQAEAEVAEAPTRVMERAETTEFVREREEYWKTQAELSEVSAPTMDYNAACTFLGLDVHFPRPYHTGPSTGPRAMADTTDPDARSDEVTTNPVAQTAEAATSESIDPDAVMESEAPPVDNTKVGQVTATHLTLKPWQVTGIAYLLTQEASVIGGSIIADDCGIGKTIQLLTAVKIAADKLAVQQAAGEEVTFRPTMVVCPANVVNVWTSEAATHFPDLRAWRWYERKEDVNSMVYATKTLPTKVDKLVEWLSANCPSDDPASAKTIIITAYDTLQGRALVQTKRLPSAQDDTAVPHRTSRNRVPANDGDDEDAMRIDDDALMHENDSGDEAPKFDPEAYTYSTLLQGMFQRLVLDEGHKIRNPSTLAAEVIRQIQAPNIHVMTATPMLNRAIDLTGYLYMLYKEEWDLDSAAEYVEFIDALPEGGCTTLDLYTDGFTPLKTPAYRPGGRLDFGVHHLPLWRLNPTTFHSRMRVQDDTERVNNAHTMLRGIIPLVMLRRTQATVMHINGQDRRIGDSIPPYRICTVELEWGSKAAEQEYMTIYEDAIKYLSVGPDRSAGDSATRTPQFKTPNTGTRSFAIHRQLGIATFSPKLHRMLQKTNGKNLVKDVEVWYHKFADDGMSYYFDMTKPEANLPLYADRWNMSTYVGKDSPKLLWTAKMAGEICLHETDPRRLLIFCDWPINQWLVVGYLKLLGFRVKTLRSKQDATEREAVIQEFNDPKSDVQILVAGLQASSAGINLQRCCSDLIILGCAANISTIFQTIGRIHRLGSDRFQRIWIVTLDHSYDQIMQASQTHKMLQQIAGEGAIKIEPSDYELSEDDIEKELAASKLTGVQLEHFEVSLRDKNGRRAQLITSRAEAILVKALGQRTSRLTWNEHRLKAKDIAENDNATPARKHKGPVQPTPGVQTAIPFSLAANRHPPPPDRPHESRETAAQRDQRTMEEANLNKEAAAQKRSEELQALNEATQAKKAEELAKLNAAATAQALARKDKQIQEAKAKQQTPAQVEEQQIRDELANDRRAKKQRDKDAREARKVEKNAEVRKGTGGTASMGSTSARKTRSNKEQRASVQAPDKEGKGQSKKKVNGKGKEKAQPETSVKGRRGKKSNQFKSDERILASDDEGEVEADLGMIEKPDSPLSELAASGEDVDEMDLDLGE